MADVIPLVLIFAAWIPLAAGVAWIFERKPRHHDRRTSRAPKANA